MTNEEMRLHLEMLLADSRSRHKDIEMLFEVTTNLVAATQADGENIRTLARIVKEQSDSIKELGRVADAHERRLSGLEGGPAE